MRTVQVTMCASASHVPETVSPLTARGASAPSSDSAAPAGPSSPAGSPALSASDASVSASCSAAAAPSPCAANAASGCRAALLHVHTSTNAISTEAAL